LLTQLSLAEKEAGFMAGEGRLVFGGWLVSRWDDEAHSVIENGALYTEDGRIADIDTYDMLRRRYPRAATTGHANYIVAPGFVNGHSHGKGLSTFQMGQHDEPLETRIVEIFHRPEWGVQSAQSLKGNLRYDPYLDTLYSALKQLASGITTTVHSHGYFNGPVEHYAEATRKIVQAYQDSGIRCGFTLGIRDRFTYAFMDDRQFLDSLPGDIRSSIDQRVTRCDMTFSQYYDLLYWFTRNFPQVKFQLGPWNPVFCSDGLLEAVADASRRDGWHVQTHLVETKYQAEYAKRAYGKSWVRRLHEIGMLSQRFSGAHCVWVEDDDIDVMKQSGMQVIHNPSSNLRLLSGVAPVRRFLAAGVPVAFGLDSLGMNDDDDMLQDLRLSQLIHNNHPGIDSTPIPSSAMLTMATQAGAAVADVEGIGALAQGNHADVVLFSQPEVEGVPTGHSLADLLLRRGKSLHVRSVMVGGRMLIEDGCWQQRSAAQLLDALRAVAQSPSTRPAQIVTQLKEVVRHYFKNYFS
jgi:5-methylthioadenosine/S-adenosylhomocysteine deaminase